MNPRERVLAALNHVQPDKVPVDMGNTISSIHVDAYRDLLRYFKLDDSNIWSLDYVSRPAKPTEDILRKFQVDTRYIYPKLTKIEPNPPLEIVDSWGIRRKFTGYYYDLITGGSPLANIKEVEEIGDYKWLMASQMGFDVESMIEQGEKLARQDYAIGLPYVFVGSFAHSLLLRGYQQFLADLILRPKIAKVILDNVAKIMVEAIEMYIRPIGRYLDFVFFGDDLGTQTTPMISPQLYRKYVKPQHKKIVDAFRRTTRAKVIIHSDGSIAPLIEDLIDVGISGINPVQVTAKSIGSKELKEKFGNKIVFWGAIDTQRVLPFGKPSDVRSEVRLRINHLAPRGGYILTSVHNIQPLTMPENVVAMFDESAKYGSVFYNQKG